MSIQSFLEDAAHEIGVIVHHNPKTIKTIEVAIGADATTLQNALVTVLNTFLTARGLTAVEPLADAAVLAMMGELQSVITAEAAK